MYLLKFGGSSVADHKRIAHVLGIIEERLQKGDKLAVVFSAFAGVTDQLIEAGTLAANGDLGHEKLLKELERKHIDVVKKLLTPQKQSRVLAHVKMYINDLEDVLHGIFLLKELSLKTLDFISSFGERMSNYIISEVLLARGLEAQMLDTCELILTDSSFGAAKVDFETSNRNIENYFKGNDKLQIITGFIAANKKGETTTLGRSGSDYTAAIFGAALKVKEIEIWTDVDGMMTADPRKVNEAFPISSMSYQEAIEMSHFGAKVIYPATMHPAMAQKIPIRIKNTFNPEYSGTLIEHDPKGEKRIIKGISSINNVALLSLQGSGMMGIVGTSMRFFTALARKGINVILISQASSEYSICVAIKPEDISPAREVLRDEFAFEILQGQIEDIKLVKNLSVVALVGENMKHSPGMAGRMFNALGKNGVNVYAIAQGSSELNISAVVATKDESKSLNALHEAFFLSDRKIVNVYLMGVGLVGGTLLNMFNQHKSRMAKDQKIELRLVGLSNSKYMVFDTVNGIDVSGWKAQLTASDKKANIDGFVDAMKEHNLPNSVFVDCTANDEIVQHYEQILLSSVSIVTPNKRANTGSYERYRKLRSASSRFGVKYLYETNVGAGLPVISTLTDLLESGDQVEKVEAVLSGTISYIFNTFSHDKPFSAVVKEAKEKGLTEPDPREDLNGLDVARKILILARDIGAEMELKDVEVENMLPAECLSAPSVEAFFAELEKQDDNFQKRLVLAEKNHEKLRFIALYENGKAKVSLQSVGPDHPFYSLSGSDNIVSFSTGRYKERPLVVKGPGAGAEVTAAGVFADILRIANYSMG